jgi:segregation and condensation protein B
MSDSDDNTTAAQVSSEAAAAGEAAATVEAILFTSDSPVPATKIAQIGDLPGQRVVKKSIAALNERYESAGSAFRIEEIAGGFQMLTCPEYHDVLARLLKARKDARLSQAAMETLAIVAYRQPILRADIEAIRGVACGEVLRGLMEKQLVKIVGRADVIGRPMLYGTTRRFLEAFGLANLKDLPNVEELRTGAAEKPAPPAEQPVEPGETEPETVSGSAEETALPDVAPASIDAEPATPEGD